MFRKVIVGYDSSNESKDAVALGHLIADSTGAELVLAGIVPQDPLTGGRDVLFKKSDADLERKVEAAAGPAGAQSLIVPSSSPARGLHELAEEIDADLIVVGSSYHGGLGRAVAGTTGQRLLEGSTPAVAIAPKGYSEGDHDLRVVAVAYDGLAESEQALSAAIALAQRAGASLRLLTGVDPQPLGGPLPSGYPTSDYREALRDHFESKLEEALEATPQGLDASGESIRGEISEGLVARAETGIDLLFIGSRGYGPVRRVLLGSVSSVLVKIAPCAVVVVPRGAQTAPSPRAAETATASSGGPQ